MRKLSLFHRPRRATLVISLVIAALLVPAGLAVAGTESAAPAKASKPESNLVQTAVAAGDFKTLVSLVKRAGLAGALSGKTKLTVFAPTDAAFKKVPKATLDSLLADKAALKRVLLYHVLAGKVPAAKVVTLRSAKTLAGPTVRIRVTGTTVRINSAAVTKADVRASNGIVHLIDRVLIPPAA